MCTEDVWLENTFFGILKTLNAVSEKSNQDESAGRMLREVYIQ
jgi:hypothetical protein